MHRARHPKVRLARVEGGRRHGGRRAHKLLVLVRQPHALLFVGAGSHARNPHSRVLGCGIPRARVLLAAGLAHRRRGSPGHSHLLQGAVADAHNLCALIVRQSQQLVVVHRQQLDQGLEAGETMRVHLQIARRLAPHDRDELADALPNLRAAGLARRRGGRRRDAGAATIPVRGTSGQQCILRRGGAARVRLGRARRAPLCDGGPWRAARRGRGALASGASRGDHVARTARQRVTRCRPRQPGARILAAASTLVRGSS